jgi:D-glycero-D-manno-heptose 1,7-bisphosphate phosphatase
MSKNKAVFLDRDGVINRDIQNYTYCIEDFELLPGVVESITELKSKGYMIIIITNQGGISKGLYKIIDVDILHRHMKSILADNGAIIDEIYFCPHHDINEKCLCRKPGSLLIEKALARFDIDPDRSFMIGDRQRDVDAGKAAGVTGILVTANSDLTAALPLIS